MKKLIIFIVIILFAVPVLASPCSDALTKYSEKLPNFTCSDNEKNDAIQDRLVRMFKDLAKKRKAQGAKPKSPVAPIITVQPVQPKQPKEKVTQKNGYQLQFKNDNTNDFKVDW